MRRLGERLRGWFPMPYVAIVVLLLVLVLVTPNLVTPNNPCAGCLSTEAVLLVDWTSTSHGNLTHLYLKGIGTVRYASIVLALSANASPPGTFRPPPTPAAFNFTNVTTWNDTVIAALSTAIDPVAINVSAVYVDPNLNSIRYSGIYAFEVADGVLYYESYLPTPGRVTSIPVTSLPITLTLTVPP